MKVKFEKKRKETEQQSEAYTTKDYNRFQILKIIKKEGPQRFKELEQKTGRSPRGLNNMLKDLQEAKRIEKVIHDGHQAYGLTKTGDDAFKNLDLVLSGRREMIIDGGTYYESYSNQWGSVLFCDLPWGIDDDLILDKNVTEEMNPITKETAIEVQEFLFKKMLSDAKKKKITLDKTKNGNIIWEFSIDYKELVKSLEGNSLRLYQNITEEELDLYQKMEYSTIRDWEYALLREVREKKITKEQFKRKLKKMQKTHANKGEYLVK